MQPAPASVATMLLRWILRSTVPALHRFYQRSFASAVLLTLPAKNLCSRLYLVATVAGCMLVSGIETGSTHTYSTTST